MYSLTLTKDERDAISWVGYRYWHGDSFRRCLVMAEWGMNDEEWDDESEITFTFSEEQANELFNHLMEDGLACFSVNFCRKLADFWYSL